MAKKGKYGHPGSSGLAQSGGINKTFGGGKGPSSPVTQGRKVGSGRLNNGLNYNVRSDGGDDSMTPFSGRIGTPPPIRGNGEKKAKVAIRKPSRGGAA